MGAQPKLKMKETLHYRKGSTNEAVNCKYCAHFVPEFPIFGTGGDGNLRRIESRCRILGLKEGIRYRVREDYRCDNQRSTYTPPFGGFTVPEANEIQKARRESMD